MLRVLKFKAEWCGPCKNVIPTVEELKGQYQDVIFEDVDIEDNPQLRAEYAVRSIPTFVAVANGKEVARRVGSGTLNEMKEFVEKANA